MLVSQMGSGFTSLRMGDSYVSRRFPTFHLEIRAYLGPGSLLVILILQSYEQAFGNRFWSGSKFSRDAADGLASPKVGQSHI